MCVLFAYHVIEQQLSLEATEFFLATLVIKQLTYDLLAISVTFT